MRQGPQVSDIRAGTLRKVEHPKQRPFTTAASSSTSTPAGFIVLTVGFITVCALWVPLRSA